MDAGPGAEDLVGVPTVAVGERSALAFSPGPGRGAGRRPAPLPKLLLQAQAGRGGPGATCGGARQGRGPGGRSNRCAWG